MGCGDPNILPFGQITKVFREFVTRGWNGPSFFVGVCNSCCIIHFQQHMWCGFIWQKVFNQRKAAWNSKEFMWHLFSMQFHLLPISVTWSVLLQSSKLGSEKKIVRSKGGSLMAAKAPKMFPIHHFNSFALSSVMYAFLSKLLPDLARDCTLHFSNFLYYVWPYGTAPNEDTLTPMICASSLIVAW